MKNSYNTGKFIALEKAVITKFFNTVANKNSSYAVPFQGVKNWLNYTILYMKISMVYHDRIACEKKSSFRERKKDFASKVDDKCRWKLQFSIDTLSSAELPSPLAHQRDNQVGHPQSGDHQSLQPVRTTPSHSFQ